MRTISIKLLLINKRRLIPLSYLIFSFPSFVVFSAVSDLNNPAINAIEVVIFICMGCGILVIWPTATNVLDPKSVYMLVGVGTFYLTGVLFYILGESHIPLIYIHPSHTSLIF